MRRLHCSLKSIKSRIDLLFLLFDHRSALDLPEAELAAAQPLRDNAFKTELATRLIADNLGKLVLEVDPG